MPANLMIGVDIGGTNLKAGLCDRKGRLLQRASAPTESRRGFASVVQRIAELVEAILAESGRSVDEIRAIGVGVPGPISRAAGVVLDAPNLTGWKNAPIRAALSEALHLPVTIENDANAAAFGEFVAGAGRGFHSLIMLTLGTGVGGGIIIDGMLVRGHRDSAGEFGHLIVHPDGRDCPCGQRGCLERYASASAIVERLEEAMEAGDISSLSTAIENGETITSAEVLSAAIHGDPVATRIWDEACTALAVACVNLYRALNLPQIVLGGGLMNVREALLSPLRARFAELNWTLTADSPEIVAAMLGDDAGVIGAASLASIADDASRTTG